MTEHYNLLDTPWLPVRLANGEVREMGLLEVFREAGCISALAETEPPSVIAQYRLLLAITHRALLLEYGAWKDSGRLRWFREGLPIDVVERYLERWRERFWLFHPQYPFMQVAALASAAETCDKQKPWAQISLASANGNTPVVFDHSYDLAPSAVSADRALCALLGFLQFTPGGLVKTVRDSDKAGALANTAAVVPLADSLAKTLCLALHPASGEAAFDLPAWEREALTIPQLAADPILASGPNDRYTRQSRAVLLLPEEEGCVRWIRFAAGQALADDVQAPDPMASYRPGANNSMVRLSFGEGRVFWRDRPAELAAGQRGGWLETGCRSRLGFQPAQHRRRCAVLDAAGRRIGQRPGQTVALALRDRCPACGPARLGGLCQRTAPLYPGIGRPVRRTAQDRRGNARRGVARSCQQGHLGEGSYVV